MYHKKHLTLLKGLAGEFLTAKDFIITCRHSNALSQHNALEVHNFVVTFDGEQLKDLDLRTDLLHTDLQTYLAILRTYLFVFSFLLILFVDLQILLIYVILSWNDAHNEVQLIFFDADRPTDRLSDWPTDRPTD